MSELEIKVDVPNGSFEMSELQTIDGPYEHMITSVAKLEGAGLDFFVSSGTALGLVRDGDFIPHDCDIDIDILVDRAEAEGMEELITDLYSDTGLKLIRTQYLSYEDMMLPMQLAYQAEDGTIIDHYIYYVDIVIGEENDTGNTQCNINEHGVMQYEQFDLVWQCTKKYGFLPMPSPIEDYFVVRYGEDWETPKKNDKGIFKEEEDES